MTPSIDARKAAPACLAVASLGAAGLAWSCASGARAAMVVYLAAFAFIMSTALGGLGLVMIAHATGARWFAVIRRLGEAVASTLPVVALFFVPVALTLRFVYPWARSLDGFDEQVRLSIEHSRHWMNAPAFLLRSLAFFIIWLGFSELLLRASRAEDRGDTRAHRRQKILSAAGIPIVGLSGSFAAFDWVMSAVPGWNFNILGAYLLIGGFCSAVGVTAVVLHVARRRSVLPHEVGAAHVHALGRLLLMSVCLWAYMAVSALVIVWSADLPSEVAFYVARTAGAWRLIAFVLFVGHFALPFVLLLVRAVKRSSAFVALLGAWLVLMHALDVYWLVVPAADRGMRVLDVAPFLLLGAVATFFGAFRFSRASAVPRNDPDLERSLVYESP